MKKILLSLALLLICVQSAWATYPNYTLCPSGCDFATLEATITDISTNHAVPATPVTITISGTWASPDTTAVTITGITTTTTNTLTITGNDTTGLWNTTNYRLIVNGASSGILDVSSVGGEYIISNLQVGRSTTSSTDTYGITDVGSSGNVLLKITNNIIKMNPNNSGSHNTAIVTNNLASGSQIINNVIYDYTQANGIQPTANSSGNTVTIENNTLWGGGGTTTGITLGSGNGTYTVENNIANDDTTDYSGTFNTHATNISQDATSPDGASYQTSSGTAIFINTVSGSENFGLSSNDTAATGRGTNLSGTFTTDITGATRTVPWDIGAFKSTGGASLTPNIIGKATIGNVKNL